MKLRVVCVKAGRDKGKFMAVVDANEKCVMLCDGKAHPLDKPKQKNIKHIAPTNSRLTQEQLKTDKTLKDALKKFNAQAE